MKKWCRFKQTVQGQSDKTGESVVIFSEGGLYEVIAEEDKGCDNTGYQHSGAYFFANGLGIEKHLEGKLYEIVEVEDNGQI